MFLLSNEKARVSDLRLESWATRGDTPRCGSMRRKMAKAVEGCWYSFLNVVPGSFSRYSASWSDGAGLTDMLGDGVDAAQSVSQDRRGVLSHDRWRLSS